jgi:hypothetical protein
MCDTGSLGPCHMLQTVTCGHLPNIPSYKCLQAMQSRCTLNKKSANLHYLVIGILCNEDGEAHWSPRTDRPARPPWNHGKERSKRPRVVSQPQTVTVTYTRTVDAYLHSLKRLSTIYLRDASRTPHFVCKFLPGIWPLLPAAAA